MPSSRPTDRRRAAAGRIAGAGLAASLVLAAAGLAPAPAQAEMSAAEKAEFGAFIREYLLDNPEVLVEAMEVLQGREQAAQQERARAAIAAHRDRFQAGPTTYAAGPENASATVVEFFDYRCGYCRRALPVLQELIQEDGDLRVVFLEFPILSEESVVAARAAMASLKQDRDKYLEFHSALMNARGSLSEPAVLAIAADLGFDTEKLKADMAAPEIERALAENQQLAQLLGVNGTPAFVIGDSLVPGAVPKAQLEALIAEARKGG